MQKIYKFFLQKTLLLILLVPFTLNAQLLVAPLTTQELLEELFGVGISFSNVVVTCDTIVQMGAFDATATNLGMTQGVLLTTGSISNAVGPNNSGAATTALNLPGDPDLNALSATGNTYDACVIEFDFIPLCDTILIRYVFASEEYPEFVGSFNDIFGFFISGPGISGLENIALIPGTTTPVSINTVNAMSNSAYYVDNLGGAGVQYDGFTVPLTAYKLVTPGLTYHVKIAIADDLDQAFDSGVFLMKEGVCGNAGMVAIRQAQTHQKDTIILTEGCPKPTDIITFRRALTESVPTSLSFEISGTATSGVDFIALPNQAVIPADSYSVDLPIQLIPDGILEATETLIITYVDSGLHCAGTIYRDTLVILIEDQQEADAGPDLMVCSGAAVQLGSPSAPGLQYQWSPAAGLSGPAIADPFFQIPNPGSTPIVFAYTLSVSDAAGCSSIDSVFITVLPEFTLTLNPVSAFCTGDSLSFSYASNGSPSGYSWDFGDGNGSSLSHPKHAFSSPGTYPVSLTLSDGQCTAMDSIEVEVLQSISASFTGAGLNCTGDTVFFSDMSTGDIDQWDWNFGDGNSGSGANPFHIYTSAGSYPVSLTVMNAGCEASSSGQTTVLAAINAQFSAPDTVCLNETFSLSDLSTGDIQMWTWDFGDGNTSGDSLPAYAYTSTGTFTLSLNAGNAACGDAYSQDITVIDCTTGIFEALPEGSVQVYPNPFGDELTIGLNLVSPGNVDIDLYDAAGRVVFHETKVTSGMDGIQLDMRDLPDGNYLLRIQAEAGTKTIKLLKSGN